VAPLVALDLAVDEAERGADRVLVPVEVRDQEPVLDPERARDQELPRVPQELPRVPQELPRVPQELLRVPQELLRHGVGAEAQVLDLQRWARRTRPVRKVKRM
jgi:hypothetical protein